MKQHVLTALLSIVPLISASKYGYGPANSADDIVDPSLFRREFLRPIPECNDVARTWIRMAFHESGTFKNIRYGSDGSLQFELDRPENVDFKESIEFFDQFLDNGVSMADAIMYGAKLAVEVCDGPHLKWRFGRIDADEANPPGLLPDPHVNVDQVGRTMIGRLGFTWPETVALVYGAHSAAKVGDPNLLPDGKTPLFTDLTPEEIDTEIFRELLDSADSDDYKDAEPGTVRLPSDAGMMKSKQVRYWVRRFARNPREFRSVFKRAFERLMDLGAKFSGR